MVLCEKPLSLDGTQGEEMVKVIEKAEVPNTVWYNYRRVPAVTLAKQIIDSGKLGQDLPLPRELPPGLDHLRRPPAGRRGPLAARCEGRGQRRDGRPARALHRHRDLAERPASTDVTAMTETFIKKRKHTAHRQDAGGEDRRRLHLHGPLRKWLARALRDRTRYARGHKALYTLEINGENGCIRWDLHDLHRLQYFDYRDEGIVRGWRSVHVTDGDQPYMKNWWVPGLQIGYAETFTHQVADFIRAVGEGKPCPPTFRDALETQYVCDAVLASAKSGKWVKCKHA